MTTPSPDRANHADHDASAAVRRELDLVAWLASDEGRAAVAELGSYDQRDALAAIESLRARGLDPARASAAATQARLRTGARERLGPWVDELILTPDGAEQATRTVVADRHAARFAAAGVPRVADLGCGIGADSLALLRAGVGVLAVERDPVTAAVARANLERARVVLARGGAAVKSSRVSRAQIPAAEVRTADALGVDLDEGDAVFADPARRSGGRRLTDPDRWSPPLSAVLAWRTSTSESVHVAGAAGGRLLGVKVAPGIDHAAIPTDMTAEWISVDGDLVEAGLWSPGLAPEGPGRHATLLRSRRSAAGPGADGMDLGAPVEVHRLREDTGAHPGALSAAAPVRFAEVRPLGSLLLEADDAVLRAGLVAAVVDMIPGAGLVGERLAYMTADALTAQAAPFVRAYRVLDVLPQTIKKLRSALRARDVGPLTIKKRATSIDVDVLRRKLALKGSRPATLVLAPVAGVPSAVLVERVLPDRQ